MIDERKELERIIRPVVEGQIKSFAKAHPEIPAAVNWGHPHKDNIMALANSIGKRITNDLLSKPVVDRIRSALSGRT